MSQSSSGSQSLGRSRREFLKTSTVAAAGASLVGTLGIARSAHASVDDTLKVGLIGCGGRGTGAAMNALSADKNVKLIAMGDAFPDRLESSLRSLQGQMAGKVDVPPERRYTGFDAYEKVLGSGVDVVILTTPPHFRPLHLKAAVAAGKHIFCEKPIAVDAPGVRSVLATAEEAKKKNLNLVSGLCYRYDGQKRETIQRIHDGDIGDVRAIGTTYLTGTLWHNGRQPKWSEMEYQVRNWLYFTWLSGDHITEQFVHSLDKAAWVMRDQPPVQAIAQGGRQVRTGELWGNIYDHFSVVYEYPDGRAGLCPMPANGRLRNGRERPRDRHEGLGPTHARHDRAAKRSGRTRATLRTCTSKSTTIVRRDSLGQPIDNSLYMCRSTMLAILGRMAAYTGQRMTWEQAHRSQEDLTPAKYEWGPIPTPTVAMPGQTKFV